MRVIALLLTLLIILSQMRSKLRNPFPRLLTTPPNNKSTLGRILSKSSLPFKTYSELGERFEAPNTWQHSKHMSKSKRERELEQQQEQEQKWEHQQDQEHKREQQQEQEQAQERQQKQEQTPSNMKNAT